MKTIKSILRALLRNRWPMRLIGIGLFIVILLQLDPALLWQTLLEVDMMLLLLSIVIQFVALAAATLRWQLIMRRLNIYIPLWRTFVHQLIGTASALMTPGQLGEFVKVLYHRREGVPVPESLLSVVVDRLFDLAMLFLLGFVALAILFGLPPALTVVMSTVAVLSLMVGFLLTRNREASRRQLVRILVRVTPKSYKDTMRTEALRLTGYSGLFSTGFMAKSVLLTVANYTLLVLRAYVVLLAMHLDVPFWYFAMIVPLIRLVGLVPISVQGIGTRDLTYIYLLGLVGISGEAALLQSTIGLIIRQVQTLAGAIAWWRHPLHVKGQPSAADASITTGAEQSGQQTI